MSTPIDREKLLSIGVMSSQKTVTEGKRADGVRVKKTSSEVGDVIEHATKDDRVDVLVKPQTVKVVAALKQGE
jgi:Flp pilus assembly protein CpaB